MNLSPRSRPSRRRAEARECRRVRDVRVRRAARRASAAPRHSDPIPATRARPRRATGRRGYGRREEQQRRDRVPQRRRRRSQLAEPGQAGGAGQRIGATRDLLRVRDCRSRPAGRPGSQKIQPIGFSRQARRDHRADGRERDATRNAISPSASIDRRTCGVLETRRSRASAERRARRQTTTAEQQSRRSLSRRAPSAATARRARAASFRRRRRAARRSSVVEVDLVAQPRAERSSVRCASYRRR